jgi:hypothetical protein
MVTPQNARIDSADATPASTKAQAFEPLMKVNLSVARARFIGRNYRMERTRRDCL